MKMACLFLLILICEAGMSQTIAYTNEEFVNAVFHEVVDTTVSAYYLSVSAHPCSFRKFDYDEWYTYALKTDVPIYILNELAEKSKLDLKPVYWHQEQLRAANCIDDDRIHALLAGITNTGAKKKKIERVETNAVYFFSKPEFSGDGEYAVIDMGYRCDNQLCGMGATFIFRRVKGKWIVAGRKIAWAN